MDLRPVISPPRPRPGHAGTGIGPVDHSSISAPHPGRAETTSSAQSAPPTRKEGTMRHAGFILTLLAVAT